MLVSLIKVNGDQLYILDRKDSVAQYTLPGIHNQPVKQALDRDPSIGI